jgi:hypothetical protein
VKEWQDRAHALLDELLAVTGARIDLDNPKPPVTIAQFMRVQRFLHDFATARSNEQHAAKRDRERLDWLTSDRLEDVRGRCNNEDVTVREAIDWFITEAGVDKGGLVDVHPDQR